MGGRRRAGSTHRSPAIAPDLAYHVAPRDACDTATAVGRAAGLIETLDRGTKVGVPRRRSAVEQLPRGQLAVEDVPADQPVLRLHPVRSDHLAAEDRAGEAG